MLGEVVCWEVCLSPTKLGRISFGTMSAVVKV